MLLLLAKKSHKLGLLEVDRVVVAHVVCFGHVIAIGSTIEHHIVGARGFLTNASWVSVVVVMGRWRL